MECSGPSAHCLLALPRCLLPGLEPTGKCCPPAFHHTWVPYVVLTLHPVSLCLHLSTPPSPFLHFPALQLFLPTFHLFPPPYLVELPLVGMREPQAAALPPWSLCILRTPRQQVPEQPQVFSPSTRVRRQKSPNTDSFGLLELGTWPGYTGCRRMGVLGCLLREPLAPPARLVPGGLASGHGAPVGGVTAAPAEPARSGKPVGFPWVCTVCVVVREAVSLLVGFQDPTPWSVQVESLSLREP